MLLSNLIGLPIVGVVGVASITVYRHDYYAKLISLAVSVINFIISLFIFILFHNSTNHFQFVQEHYNTQYFDLYLGVDGISIYFVLLTTIIMPIALLSN
mgnify:CR=1 FL=1|jgi:NADH:ubiquinone oxidoreductase subunit 4 (subunit M)